MLLELVLYFLALLGRAETEHEFIHGDRCCLDDSHKISLENYYSDIVSAIIYAESFLPKTDPNVQRSFWNEELTDLK